MTKTPPKKNPSFGRTVFCGRFFWGREPPKLLEGIGINVMYKARKSWAWPARRGARFSKNQGFSGKLGEVDPDFFQQQIRNIQNFKVDLMILSYLIQDLLSSLKNRWIDVFFGCFSVWRGKFSLLGRSSRLFIQRYLFKTLAVLQHHPSKRFAKVKRCQSWISSTWMIF